MTKITRFRLVWHSGEDSDGELHGPPEVEIYAAPLGDANCLSYLLTSHAFDAYVVGLIRQLEALRRKGHKRFSKERMLLEEEMRKRSQRKIGRTRS